ncbi:MULTISPECIES: tubulin-like doman-containing protein [unclassified Pseudofrankia]|uniref:tubulin-like doman-containing protein n=1 Tax=unclassified Pseudofrankia TaxID=2994372 RepID=UPI0008DAF311|nr:MULTISPECIES: tubulin-like doman-containing protein [unclassified Pseudofrankia]MDT3443541.1 tubulin-like doman-containing protein [Pseudofrankia sp. BMG5.37]OHV42740.1 hypothetical protein BCD48_30340 [Pseudofrankia sp. BMG5.36]
MNIYQPMMFVGLGGTGCAVGAELERRLRDELCGPDGRDLMAKIPSAGYLPYQLPAPLQFVYADLNEGELTALSGRAGSEEHRAAVGRTQHLTHGLVPRFDTYPQVAMSLRANATDYVRGWLPGTEHEPKIAPLLKGAGQLPTVGRAALFETFRGGLGQAQGPINDAIGAISNSGDALLRLGGRLGQSCDVFVAFSVAGGTGAGIFYDYLYLIGDAFQRSDYRAQIYPLVLMPSAFEDKLGGGRRARLNSARALVDLFRLVDSQNGSSASMELSHRGVPGSLGVLYPGQERATSLLPSTVQTAFLFSGSAGVRRDDLHRSIVSLMLSLVGTGQRADAGSAGGERFYQSFADDFINRGVEREVPASSGVGLRGVSTSLVASMTIPVDDLADVVASRLLARALDELATPPPGGAEENRELVDGFVTAANLAAVRGHRPPPFTDVEPVNGAEDIVAALRTRSQTMESNVQFLEDRLRREVAGIAADFDPYRALESLLGGVDLLRARRVIEGERRLASPPSRAGVAGLLDLMRRSPRPPAGIAEAPPQLGDLRNKFLGMSKMRWSDDRVQRLLTEQDNWYAWQAERAWSAAWSDQAGRWGRTFDGLRSQLTAVVDELEQHVQEEPGLFAQRTAALYRSRVGVTYLLPPHGDLDAFYRDVLDRFAHRDHTRQRATEADIVNSLLGSDGWLRAWQAGQQSPAAAVATLRERLKQEVKRLFTQDVQPGTQPLLPTMASLLMRAARPEDGGGGVVSDEIRQFEAKIHGLVPAGFTPQGSGDLKVLISYPAGAADEGIERFLRDRLRLPRDSGLALEFRPITAESIAVVLFRTSMGLTEVPEVREIIHFWSEAVTNEFRQDFLKWRQRLSYDFSWTVTTEEDRVRILHHLLCALWNGHIGMREGDDPESPARLRVQLGDGGDRVAMTLPLTRYGRLSSWSSLLRSYEEWVLADDDVIRRDFCEQLMHSSPHGIARGPVPPAELFLTLYKVAEALKTELDERRALRKAGPHGHVQEFWTKTFPAALDLPFENVSLPVFANLRELVENVSTVRRGRSARADQQDPVIGRGDDDYDDNYTDPWR